MLLINGIVTLIGIVIALIVYVISIHLGVHGASLIFVGGLGLYLFLFLSDVIEDKLIELFDKS